MNSSLSIKGRLLTFALCISIIPLVIIMTIFYLRVRSTLTHRVLEHLKAVAESREQHVLSLVEKMKERTVDFSADGFLRNGLERIVRGGTSKQNAVIRLNRYLSKSKLLIYHRHLMAIILVDKYGKVFSSTNAKLIGMDMSGQDIFKQEINKGSGEPSVGQPHCTSYLGVNYLCIAAPIISHHRAETLGVIINVYSLASLNEITTSRIGMGKTGEIYLVNKDKILLTESRFTEDVPFKQVVDTEPVRKIVGGGKDMVGIYQDYRDNSVVGASIDIAEYGWILLAEMDKAEAFAPLKTSGIIALIFGVVGAGAITTVGINFATSTSIPIKNLKDATERLAGGDLDYRVTITRRDEIGALARSFNSMAEELKREITEHKRAEEVLKESEQRFRTIFESATDGILLADVETKKFYTGNKTICQILGYNLDEIEELGIVDIHPKEDLPHVIEQFEKQAKREIILAKDIPVKRKNGSVFYADINTALVPLDGKTYLMGIFRDITDRKQIEKALRVLNDSLEQRIAERTAALVKANKELTMEIAERKRIEEELRKLFNAVEQSSCSVVITDLKGNIEYVNPKFSRVTGYAPEEIIGQNPRILKSGEKPSEEYKLLWDTITTGGEWQGEFHNKKKNGALYWEYASISPIRNPEGVTTHFVAIKEDITERKRVADELTKQRNHLEYLTNRLTTANKELEAFCYSVSHDMRAPLRSINGFSKALIEDYSDTLDSQGKNYLQRVMSASRYMGQLIDDLLNLSRITRSEMHRKKFDLSALAETIATKLRESEPERRAEFVIAKGLITEGDPHLIRIALENLLGNAWKFTRKCLCARIEFGVAQYNGKPAYFLRDNGAGFDMAFVNKLFGAFQRLHSATDFEGTGIGLATVQRIIHRHGGQIWAEGAVDQGATFYFTI